MSDENTTPRRVDPEGPVPEDRVPEPEAPESTDDTDTTDTTDTTLLLEQHPPTAALPSQPAPASPAEPATSPAETVTSMAEPLSSPAEPLVSPAPWPADRSAGAGVVRPPGGLVTVRTGPRPGAIMLGLLCLLVAAYTMIRQTTEWRFDLSLVGPISIGAFGTLLLLVGLVGLLSRRRS
jgi:hypothetical protein